MNIYKLSINGTNIPILGGTLRLFNIGDDASLEVELDVHPTVVNYVNTMNYIEEQITILTNHNDEISGTFSIHTGKSSILLESEPNEVIGIDNISSFQYENRFLPVQQEERISLDNELKIKQKSLLINILKSLLENELEDEGNRVFINTLLKKLTEGKKLNSFDQFIKDEVSYLVEEAMTKKI